MPRVYRRKNANTDPELQSDDSESPNHESNFRPPPLKLIPEDTTPPEQETVEGERVFDVELSITLKPAGGKATKIPMYSGTIRGNLVEESIALAFADKRFKKIVAAVLDNPKVMPKAH